jgi:hypothetical protein
MWVMAEETRFKLEGALMVESLKAKWRSIESLIGVITTAKEEWTLVQAQQLEEEWVWVQCETEEKEREEREAMEEAIQARALINLQRARWIAAVA